jgi:hypothetical protein
VKVLLIPFAILAFVFFLLVLGAIGLAISFAILYLLGGFWRLVSGVGRIGRSRKG